MWRADSVAYSCVVCESGLSHYCTMIPFEKLIEMDDNNTHNRDIYAQFEMFSNS